MTTTTTHLNELVGTEVLPAEQAVLTVRDLRVSYGPVRALTGASLGVSAGTIMAIVGMNGSGKSTFFNAIMGRVPTENGEITVCGKSAPYARRAGLVGYVPQNDGIDKNFPITVREVVMMGRYGKMNWTRRPRKEDEDATTAALEMVGLTNLADRPIGALSGGQRKRAFVARALAQGARVMLLDEPFAGVDFTSERVIVELLKKMAKNGTSLLVSTHDLASIPRFADEVALLNRKVHLVADPQTALQDDNLVKAFSEGA
ncbi:MAG: metal ABC transporter ATP-binding protein [Actinomycetaceae bacterium]|nr:metal ABC transporter ATP-binding protein [Actinomycetaceae bacterium]